MYRMNSILFYFLIYITSIKIGIVYSCIFDEIQIPINKEILKSASEPRHNVKHKRNIDINLDFKPIRLYSHFEDSVELSFEEITRLKSVLNDAFATVSNLLSVQPVEGNLYLKRLKACSRIINNGLNHQKCAGIKKGYKNEYCINKVDSFAIPQEHLLGVTIYNQNDIKPILSLPNGAGIPNADFVLYISSKNNDLCQKKNIIAYSSFCQLDENDRPIAGFVNFCPLHLKENVFSYQKIKLAVIHELFHTLGFSAELFPKFKDCDEYGNCFEWKTTVFEDHYTKFNLPAVVREMQIHFGCSKSNFGAPLEKLATNGIGSHWDPLILYNSIMSPNIHEFENVAIDPISAALFENTGWYKVNYSATENYHWAKDSGCNFEKFEDCTYYYTCHLSDNLTSGCDINHSTVSECKSISAKRNCGVFQASVNKICDSKACLAVSNENTTEGKCFDYRCLGEKLHFLMKDHWLPCPFNSQVDIEFLPNFETVHCQASKTLCQRNLKEDVHYQFLKIDQKYSNDNHSKIWIKLLSPTPKTIESLPVDNEEELEKAVVNKLIVSLGIPLDWVHESRLVAGELFYWLFLHFSEPFNNNLTKNETKDIETKISKFVLKGNITMQLHDLENSSAYSLSNSAVTEGIQGLTALYVVGGIILGSAVISSIITTVFQRQNFRTRSIIHFP